MAQNVAHSKRTQGSAPSNKPAATYERRTSSRYRANTMAATPSEFEMPVAEHQTYIGESARQSGGSHGRRCPSAVATFEIHTTPAAPTTRCIAAYAPKPIHAGPK